MAEGIRMARWSSIALCLCTLVLAGASPASGSTTRPPSMGELNNRINPEYQRISRRAKVKIGSGTVVGACSKSKIKSSLDRMKGAYETCYWSAFRKGRANPGAGRVDVSWTVDPRGMALHVRSKATQTRRSRTSLVGLEPVAKCIGSKFRSHRFPAPSTGVCQLKWRLLLTAPKERKRP